MINRSWVRAWGTQLWLRLVVRDSGRKLSAPRVACNGCHVATTIKYLPWPKLLALTEGSGRQERGDSTQQTLSDGRLATLTAQRDAA